MSTASLRTDVVVVGLGGMGSQALWALARRGVPAVGVEQFAPGHSRGSTHGESRITRSAYFEGAGYVPLVHRATRLWRELEDESGTRLLTPTGGLNVGPADGTVVAGALAAARAHGLPVEKVDAAALRRRWPHLVGDDIVGVLEEQAGVLRPEAGVVAAVDAATRAGATVLTGTAVTGVEASPDGVVVRTADGEIAARHAVVAAGAWLGRLVPALAARLRVIRRVVGWHPVDEPAAYAPERFPVFIRDDGDGLVWYGIPSLDGRTVKLAVHVGQPDEVTDPAAGMRPPDQADAELLGRLARRLRGVAAEPERMAPCMYTMTPDGHFVVGSRRELPGVTLLGGFSGHGFKFATALGEAAAQLATDGVADADLSLFDPHRFDEAAG